MKVGVYQHDVDISTMRIGNLDLSSEDFRAIYSSGKFRKFGQMMFNVNTRYIQIQIVLMILTKMLLLQ
jgi:hypothetical protein